MQTADPIARLAVLFKEEGAREYSGEVVSLSAHMLQAASLAQASGAADHLVAAALLHDVGHLPSLQVLRDHRHEETAAQWLAGWLPPVVTEPVRLHVAAKRYLCATDPGYAGTLSEASAQSLVFQGGPMTEEEAHAFEQLAYALDAVAVRRWDDTAKDPEVQTPDFNHFRPLLERVSQK